MNRRWPMVYRTDPTAGQEESSQGRLAPLGIAYPLQERAQRLSE